MHKNTFWYASIILVIYFTLVFCDEAVVNVGDIETPKSDADLSQNGEVLEVEGRTRRHRFGLHHHMWGWHALALAYFVKIKVAIVAFFLGSALFLGLRHYWPNNKCSTPEIVYDHPPPSFTSYGHHEHTPYSFAPSDHIHAEHSYDSSASFDPYSGYSASPDVLSSVGSGPEEDIHHVSRRSADNENIVAEEQRAQRQHPTEEQIADFMLSFLGLDTPACRRRFICEMEFRSKLSPITSMAFRIVGRGFFEKYTNALNPHGRATDFFECAKVNSECVFVDNEEQENETESSSSHTEQENDIEIVTNSVDQETENLDAAETENKRNLIAERRHASLRHRRGDRKLDTIATHIMTQSQ